MLAGALAAYPWLAVWGVVHPRWRLWLLAIGLHALWLGIAGLWRPALQRVFSGLALAGLAGVGLAQLVAVYGHIVGESLGKDFYTLAALIRWATINPLAPPVNNWWSPVSLIQNDFDLVTPLVSRAFDLTHDPFRLLAFHSVMVLSAPFFAWCICLSQPGLRAFQFAFPLALLVHPSLSTAMMSDYHESELGVGLLLLGTYWFFLDRGKRARGFWPLLLGTLLKVSYWPSWFMFGVVSAFRRQWRWTAAYLVLGVLALAAYQRVNQGTLSPGAAEFLGPLGSSPIQVARNVVFHPELWIHSALQPNRWVFFAALLLGLGFCIVAFPLAVVPLLPLVALTLLDVTGHRAVLTFEYASEYLGYIAGGSLVGLAVASRWLRLAILSALALGMTVSLQLPADPNVVTWTTMNLNRANVIGAGYFREAEFSQCAVGDAPVVATYYNWITFARENLDRVWIDEAATMRLPDSRWDSFETLVSPHGGQWSFSRFPNVLPEYDVAHYQAVLDRLPVHVVTPRGSGWDYWGGQRLKDCAARSGYKVVSG